MLFEINEPAFVDGQYITASAQFPQRVTIPDDKPDLVSLTWLACDESAKKAQITLRDAKNKANKDAGSKHRVEILRAPGASQVAVGGGKKVATGLVAADAPAPAAEPIAVGQQNPIGA